MKIIDVRTKSEYDAGHIDGAILHDSTDIMRGIFPDVNKNTYIVLYCRSGGRSGRAQVAMTKAGFTNVINGGGMNELQEKINKL